MGMGTPCIQPNSGDSFDSTWRRRCTSRTSTSTEDMWLGGVRWSRVVAGHGTWVRRFEHLVLRLVALAFSLASAHAIRWFFAPLDGVDALQPAITWTVAIGFGVLGYFVSRGLAHRMMNKERIRAYAPICIIVELVEIFCNYALAAAVIQRAKWLSATPPTQHATLTVLTYVVLSIIPLVSMLLAVVDMDLERHKHGAGGSPGSPVKQVQPRWAGSMNGNNATSYTAPTPTYGQGYQVVPGKAPTPGVPRVPVPEGGNGNGVPPFSPVQVTSYPKVGR